MFVRARGQLASLGIGKLISRTGQRCSVEFFDAPVSEPKIVDLDGAEIEEVRLAEQTRIYHFNDDMGAWEIGRLLDDQGDKQFIKFPNGVSRRLMVSDVFVRSGRPILDPTAFLAAKISETPRFADGRSKFVRSIITQRAAAMGMSAVTSSAVELEAHQIEVVRRVLQDPVQRYLLADEVGLGKTIEAGILVRQHVIDTGNLASVLVVAPDVLVEQWRSELGSKFFLGHCLDKTVHVAALGDGARIRSLLDAATMLVVDEAHHLTDRRSMTDQNLYGDIAAAARGIERILLLSATPALHNERGFLEMLHLLDPDTYALDDEEGFRSRIEKRQALAEIVAGLTPENALFLDSTLDRLAELFPHDEMLAEQTKQLRAVSDTMPSEDDPRLVEAVGLVRSHLSESYRLHRRILRHRRRGIAGLTPGRVGMQVVNYASPQTASLLDALEDWRLGEMTIRSATESDDSLDHGAEMFARILGEIFEHSIGGSISKSPISHASRVGDPESLGRLLRRVDTTDMFEARMSALVRTLESVNGAKQQFVVFCSDPTTADALTAELAVRLKVPVDRHDPEDDGWQRFNLNSGRSILVCDQRAEEGLNLQGGQKIVVHFDLPLNPNRIEQRLGRVDRYGSGEPVRSIVLRCSDDPMEARWINYLNDALRVFDRSIASLQYLIDDSTRGLAKLLFEEGLEALGDLTERSIGDNGVIEREMRNIDQQDALETLGAPSSDAFDALTDVDEDWEATESDTSKWIEDTLLFKRTAAEALPPAVPQERTIFRFRYNTFNQHTLVPLETFYERCREAIDLSPASQAARMIRTVPLTFRRRSALGRQGRAVNARVLRFGDPLIAGMWEIAQADDRGRSTALWRYMPDYSSDDVADLFFRFDFVVSADLEGAREILARDHRLTPSAAASISRRGDMVLPPFFQTLWLDRYLTPVEEVATVRRLAQAYSQEPDRQGSRDFNLNPKRWRQMAKLDVPQLAHWADLCTEARLRAEACLRRLPSFTGGLAKAALRATEFDRARLGHLRARADRNLASADAAEWSLEKSLSESLIVGIREPTVHVDAVLACFLSGNREASATVDGRE